MTRFTTAALTLILALATTIATAQGTYLAAAPTARTSTLLAAEGVHPTTDKSAAAAYAALPYITLSKMVVRKSVTLNLPANEAEGVTANLLDASGRQIATLPVVAGRLDLKSLTPGAYYLEVHGAKTYRTSLIKA